MFQCRDEGPIRARVRWTRPNGEPLPPGSRDNNGRLEMPNIKVEHSGSYICEAMGFPPSTPGAQVSVHLQVDRCKYLVFNGFEFFFNLKYEKQPEMTVNLSLLC